MNRSSKQAVTGCRAILGDSIDVLQNDIVEWGGVPNHQNAFYAAHQIETLTPINEVCIAVGK